MDNIKSATSACRDNEKTCDNGDDDTDELDGLQCGNDEDSLDLLRRNLLGEINQLEWEFSQAKEALYNRRVSQSEAKLAQARDGSAPELINLLALVDDAYRLRIQNAKSAFNFSIESTNKYLEGDLQTAQCMADEYVRMVEDNLISRMKERLCDLSIEKALLSGSDNLLKMPRHTPSGLDSLDHSHPGPGVGDLMPPSSNEGDARLKKSTDTSDQPFIVYQLEEDEIQDDLDNIVNALKEQGYSTAGGGATSTATTTSTATSINNRQVERVVNI